MGELAPAGREPLRGAPGRRVRALADFWWLVLAAVAAPLGDGAGRANWGGLARVRVFSKKLLRCGGVFFGWDRGLGEAGVDRRAGGCPPGRVRGRPGRLLGGCDGSWGGGVLWGADSAGWGDWRTRRRGGTDRVGAWSLGRGCVGMMAVPRGRAARRGVAGGSGGRGI